MQLAITAALVYYAKVTIDEAKKDRKKAILEHRLENIYYPMYDILYRARDEKWDRESERNSPLGFEPAEKWMFVLTYDEFKQVQAMITRFGYCLEERELGTLKFDLEKAQTVPATLNGKPPRWVRLPTDVFDIEVSHFQSRSRELTSQLESIAGFSETKKKK